MADGKRFVCGTICLDAFADNLNKRITNFVYDRCRNKTLSVAGFPEFTPLLQALKDGQVSRSTRQYQATVEQQGNLVILQSIAQKFVDSDATKEKANDVIKEHNEKFNPTGDFWFCDERTVLHHDFNQ